MVLYRDDCFGTDLEYAHDAHPVRGAVGIFMIQQIGMTPILQARSDQIIAGLSPNHSNVHVIYAVLEVIKFICLLIFSSRVLAAPVTLTALAAAQRKNPAL